jgi:hypothetical protein
MFLKEVLKESLEEALKNYFAAPSNMTALNLSAVLANYKSSDAVRIFSDAKREMGVA